MIFFHSHYNEYSTDLVVQYYLYSGGGDFCRHNESESIDHFSLEMNANGDVVNFSADQTNFELDEKVNVFYRRGQMIFNSSYAKIDFEHKDFQKFATNELRALRNYSSISLHSRPGGFGGYYEEVYNNKLIQLNKAREAGLTIPNTFITNNKKRLLQFIGDSEKLIFKPITDHPGISIDNVFIAPQGTKMVTEEFLNDLPDRFFPTLFQEVVQKKIEIRSFHFADKFYSTAIFSQTNEKTKLDFRNYDREKENRFVPFKLPVEIEEKLKKTYEKLNLDTGSADLILTPENDYVFLEINPVGQFAGISETCNYHLENKLAQYLCRQEN